MKKKIGIVMLILGLFSLVMPVKANESLKMMELASKKSFLVDATTGKYRVELKVPGQDGTNEHDEVILMVDGSYSLDEEWPQMKNAIIEIGKSVLNGNGNTQLTLMAFGMGDNEVLTHVTNVDDLASKLGVLPGTLLYGRSSTNCEAGFTGVMEYINNHDETLNDAYVVYISDGNINTDETTHNFYNWRENSWLRWPPKIIIEENIYSEIVNIKNGGNPSEAFTKIYGNLENLEDAMASTMDEKNAWADLVWDSVYEEAGLDKTKAYPVSDVERAFVKYDKTHGTYIQDLFYYALVGRSYPNRGTRTPAAGTKLAEMDKVKALYMIDYDGYTAWMDTGIKSEKSTFIKSNGISGLVTALDNVLVNLASTPYNDVVITDYMSKWVNLDLSSLKIVDDTKKQVIYTITDGWLIEEAKRPVKLNNPIIIDKVDPTDYVLGGKEVIGNTNGDIYRLKWYVKEGAMLRSENYHIEYNVYMDDKEQNFEYNKNYFTNGNTTISYKDENNNEQNEMIKVPTGILKNPSVGKMNFKKGSASHVAFLYVDSEGNIKYANKIDFDDNDTNVELPYKDGYTLVVFIKQSTSGMIWSSNQLEEETLNNVVAAIKKYDKAYKGHNAVAYGNGKHVLTYTKGNKKNTKTVTYEFN